MCLKLIVLKKIKTMIHPQSKINSSDRPNTKNRKVSRTTAVQYRAEISKLNQENKRLKRTSLSVAHDLKNHLQSLLLTIESKPEHKQEAVYQRILHQTLAMKETVSLISEYDNVYNQRHSTDPIQILFETSMLWDGEVTVGMVCDFDDGKLAMHKGAFRQIMINLIGNSVKHSVRRPITVFLSLRRKDKHMEFTYKDNGEGIPEHIIEYLEKLQPAENPGTDSGTGLWLIREIIEENNGKLWFENGEMMFLLPAEFGPYPED